MLVIDVSFILITCAWEPSVYKFMMQGEFLRADFLRFELDLFG